jgi:hypothetical protein
MNNLFVVLLACGGSTLLVILEIAYIILAIQRTKRQYPNCSRKTVVKRAPFVDPATDVEVEGEADFGFAVLSSLSGPSLVIL